MKTALALALLFAGTANAATCANTDRTLAAEVTDASIKIYRLNGIMPALAPEKTLALVPPFRIEAGADVVTLKARLDDHAYVAIRYKAPGAQNQQAALKSVRIAYSFGELFIFDQDCR